MDVKSYKNVLIYEVLYKTFIGAKPLRFMFDKVDKFIRGYNETKYLTLFGSKKYDSIFKLSKYLVALKSIISYVVSHNYGKIKIDSDDEFPS